MQEPTLPSKSDFTSIKSLKEWNKKTAGQIFGFYLTSAWYFDKWYEKLLLLLGLGALGIWKITNLIGLF